MIVRTTLLILIFHSVAVSADAQPVDPTSWCGAGPEFSARIAKLDEETRLRSLSASGADPRSLRLVDGIYVLRADDQSLPGHRPVDLHGKTLRFSRSEGGYTVSAEPLAYDENVGSGILLRASPGATPGFSYRRHELRNFRFPFEGAERTSLYVSMFGAIYFAPPSPEIPSSHGASAVHTEPAMIAPMRRMKLSATDQVTVYISESSDAVTVTWRANIDFSNLDSRIPLRIAYDYQAVLTSSGEVRFSYRSYPQIGGLVAISSGVDMFASAPRTTLLTATDPAGDADATLTPWSSRADIVSADLNRIANLDVLELVVRFAGPIDPPPGEMSIQFPGDPEQLVKVWFNADGVWRVAIGLEDAPKRDATVHGDTFTVRFPESVLVPPTQGYYRVIATARNATDAWGGVADHIDIRFHQWPVVPHDEFRFSEVSGIHRLPLAESFSTGSVNPMGVARRLKELTGYANSDVDHIGIVTSFYSELLYGSLLAYACCGNTAVQGIGRGIPANPSPELLGLNRTFFIEGVEAHEVLHRWGDSFEIIEDGQRNRGLTDGRGHPQTFVDTRGPFGFSVLGGSWWNRSGAGGFVSACANGGMSWQDLYAMGLVAPDEVPPWFYFPNGPSQRMCGLTVAGEPRAVTIGQVEAAMGKRVPASAQARRHFRMLYVLLDTAADPASDADIASVVKRASELQIWFQQASGGRGSMTTRVVVPARRRAVRQ